MVPVWLWGRPLSVNWPGAGHWWMGTQSMSIWYASAVVTNGTGGRLLRFFGLGERHLDGLHILCWVVEMVPQWPVDFVGVDGLQFLLYFPAIPVRHVNLNVSVFAFQNYSPVDPVRNPNLFNDVAKALLKVILTPTGIHYTIRKVSIVIQFTCILFHIVPEFHQPIWLTIDTLVSVPFCHPVWLQGWIFSLNWK